MKRLTAAEITAAVGGILAAGDGEHPITGISIDKVTAKVMPYLLILLVDLVILTYIPSIITFLPNMLR